MKKIVLQLVTYNGEKFLPQCLQSILDQTCQDFILIIIDNASTDSTKEILGNFQKENLSLSINFIQNTENFGFSQAHNRALESSQTPYVHFLNQDIILAMDFVEKSIDFLEMHPEVASISPKLLRLTNGEKTRIIDSLGITFLRSLQAIDLASGKEEGNVSLQPFFSIFGPSGACCVYRRTALFEVVFFQKEEKEYLDQDFFMYKDDVDLSYRIAWLGWESMCVGDIEAYHERSARAGTHGSGWWNIAIARKKKKGFINFLSYRNHWFWIIKNLPFSVFLRHFPFWFWYEWKKIIYLIFFEQSTLRAIPQIFLALPLMRKKRKQIFLHRKRSAKDIERRMFLNTL